MRVGVNYPWVDYGWDFGLAPPGWRGAGVEPRWYGEIDRDLRHFRSLGISVVRWFILADGLTYGNGPDAPRPDPGRRSGWRFDAPLPGPDLLLHFEELLDRFALANVGSDRPIQLLPVLIDFHFCQPGALPVTNTDPALNTPDPDWVKQGRADVVTDPACRGRFLDRVLDPMLAVARAQPDLLFAWELINEPEWITNGWHPDRRADHPVDEASMRAFIGEGMARIRAAGLMPTVGFAMIDTLRASGISAEINQFHHYPDGARRLEPHPFAPSWPGIIGEFATAPSDVWPELPADQQDLFNRLSVAEAQGYPLALPWSFRAVDRHTVWSPALEADLLHFTGVVPASPATPSPTILEAPGIRRSPHRTPLRTASRRCRAATKSGTRCSRIARRGTGFCWQHRRSTQ